jgi:hypothetical protein
VIRVPDRELKLQIGAALLASHARTAVRQRIVAADLRDQAVEIEDDELAAADRRAGRFEPHAPLADGTERPGRRFLGLRVSHGR